MKTKHKILIAKVLYFIVSIINPKKIIKIKKNRINWELDLSEGIDLSIFLFGKFEHQIINAISRHKLSKKPIFFDIGANIGVQTLQLGEYFKGSIIHAFEPTNFGYNKMQKNISLNPILKKTIYINQTFLTNKKKEIPNKIYASWSLENKKNVHKKHLGSYKKTSNANSFKLDTYIIRKKIKKIDFIKLDVDGHELDVLKSGYKFLKKKRVPIIFEVAPYLYEEYGYTYTDLINLFKELGYKFYNIYNLKKIKNINEFILSIKDGASTTLIAK
jgi:FkbM family methyltransferase